MALEKLRIKDNIYALQKLNTARDMAPKEKETIDSWIKVFMKYNERLEQRMQQIAGDNIFPVDHTGEEDKIIVEKTINEMEAFAEKKLKARKQQDEDKAEKEEQASLSEIILFSANRLKETFRLLENLQKKEN